MTTIAPMSWIIWMKSLASYALSAITMSGSKPSIKAGAWMISESCPAVKIERNGLCLAHQLLNESWWSIHHATDPWPEALLFFAPAAMLMNSNDCAIQEKLFQINIIGDLFQQTFPNPFFAPTGVPRVDTVPVAKGGKQVAPR